MTLGTGVGSAAVMEGQLLRGKHFTAGILGVHSVINYKGDLCNCGNKGCVETEASTWNLPATAKTNKILLQASFPPPQLLIMNLFSNWLKKRQRSQTFGIKAYRHGQRVRSTLSMPMIRKFLY
jgi:hypothetical protein